MSIRLDLAKHCIETEIKRRHEAAMSRYFKGGKDKDAIEAELILLENALNAFDFDRLRVRWAILSGGDDRPVFLTGDDDERPCLLFDDQRVVPPADEK
jgi:hypothetical protein